MAVIPGAGAAALGALGGSSAVAGNGTSPLSQAAVDLHHGLGRSGAPPNDAAGVYYGGDGAGSAAAMAPTARPSIAMVKAPMAGGNGRSSASVASPSASTGAASPMVSVSGRSAGQGGSGQRRKSSKAGGGGGSSSKRRAHRASGQSAGAAGASRGGTSGSAASAGGAASGGQGGRGSASRGKHTSLDMTPRLQPSPEAELIDPDSDNEDAGHVGSSFDSHHHHHHHHHGRPHHGTTGTVTLQQFSGAATSASAATAAMFSRASSSVAGDRVTMLQPVAAGASVFQRISAGAGAGGQRPRGKSEATIAFRQAPPLADFGHDEAFPFANDASSAAVQRRRAQSLAAQGKHSKSVPLAPLALPGSGLGVTNVQMSPGGLLYGLARQHAAAQSVGGSPSLNFAQGDSTRGDQARGDDSDDDAGSPAHPTAFRRGRFPPGLDVSTAESPALDGGHHMPLGRGRRGVVHRSRRASRARADEDEDEDESGLNHHHHHHHHHQQRHQPHHQHHFAPPASSIPLGDVASSARAAAAAAAFAHGGQVGLGGNSAKRVRMAGVRDASAASMSAATSVTEARPPPVVAAPSALSWATAAADQARQQPPAVV